jgi:two-component system sensor histidine kinase PilS (NtrC family)
MNANELALLGQAGQGPLRLYHLYRLLIGLSLVLLISSSLENQLLNVTHSRLFTLGSWGYLIINTLIILVMPRAERLAPLFALALFDVLLLSLLYYAAGGTPKWYR